VTTCCSGYCDIADRQFSEKLAARDLKRYQQKGPGPTTRLMRDCIVAAGAARGHVLDVGGGVGALSFELLDHGVAEATVVDASSAYTAAAQREARAVARARAMHIVHADFLSATDSLPTVDIVALDRVVCCYPSYAPLLGEAMRHSTRYVALSYPRDLWHVRSVVAAENLARRLSGNPFRSFVHPASAMAELAARQGFTLRCRKHTIAWQVDLLERTGS
jgi:magnesium-protoporphyrin O-methyltransferase